METRKLKIEFPLTKLSTPVFSTLVKRFDVEPNVLAADIDAAKGGWLLVGVTGEPATLDAVEAWVNGEGMTVTVV